MTSHQTRSFLGAMLPPPPTSFPTAQSPRGESSCTAHQLTSQELRPGWPTSPSACNSGVPQDMRLSVLKQGQFWANCEALATPAGTVLARWEP